MPHERHSSRPTSPTALSQPLRLPFSNLTAPNRILNTSMTEYMASWDVSDRGACGTPGPELTALYRRWAEGEPGIMTTGNIMVDAAHLEQRGNMIVGVHAPLPDSLSSIEDEAVRKREQKRFQAYEALARAAKSEGSLFVAQISHPGRQCPAHLQPDPVSASTVQVSAKNELGAEFAKPHAATRGEIKEIVNAFAHAAAYLETAGFDGVQLHGAHGYLLAQFLSLTTNQREDEYGGELENRARLITEIAREIRQRCKPTFSLGIKLNSVEFQDRGLQPDEAVVICQILEREGFDWVELSGGTYEQFAWKHQRESARKREGYFLEWADMIVPALTKTKVFVTGGFRTVGGMVDALKTVDGIGLGRPVAQEPLLPKQLLCGQVQGCVKSPVEDQYTLAGAVAGAQMKQMSEGREPFDASDPKLYEAFVTKDLGAFVQALQQGKVGHADVVAAAAVSAEDVEASNGVIGSTQ